MNTINLIKESEAETAAMATNTVQIARALASEVRALREEVRNLKEANMILRKRIGETRLSVEEALTITEKEEPFLTSYDPEEGNHTSILEMLKREEREKPVPASLRSKSVREESGSRF